MLIAAVLQNAGTRPPHPPRPPFGRRSPPVSRPAVSGGGQTWRWVRGWCFALCVGFAECGNTPPAPSALPPEVGLLGEDLGVEVRIGRPREAHCRSRSSRVQNTNAQEATRTPPPGGSAEAQRGAGGVFTHSARPARGLLLSDRSINASDNRRPRRASNLASARARASRPARSRCSRRRGVRSCRGAARTRARRRLHPRYR